MVTKIRCLEKHDKFLRLSCGWWVLPDIDGIVSCQLVHKAGDQVADGGGGGDGGARQQVPGDKDGRL